MKAFSQDLHTSFSWGEGHSFKIRSMDDTLVQPKFIGWLSCAIKSKIFRRSPLKLHLFKQFIF